jgi:hypothetical protein
MNRECFNPMSKLFKMMHAFMDHEHRPMIVLFMIYISENMERFENIFTSEEMHRFINDFDNYYVQFIADNYYTPHVKSLINPDNRISMGYIDWIEKIKPGKPNVELITHMFDKLNDLLK